MNNKYVKILDCTLRDGGYCNNWEFGLNNSKYITKKLMSAGIDIIECGFLSQKKQETEENTIFNTVSAVKAVLPEGAKTSEFVCMINYGEFNIDDLEEYDGTSIDSIRVAFHQKDLDDAIEVCRQIKEKGYGVYVQPMVTLNYSDAEILKLVSMTNEIGAKALYIVDSFGVVRRKDLLRMYYLIDHNLDSNIVIGYHSHNNLQLAYSNAQALSEIHSSRVKIIDSSVFGMGRGAGNLNTELFVEYLNDYIGTDYTVFPLLQIIDNVLNKFYFSSYWGYSLPHYLSSKYNCHPNYASYLSDKNTLTIEAISEILGQIPPEKKINFNKEFVEQLYVAYQGNYADDKETISSLEKKLEDKDILIIAPGQTIHNYKVKVDESIKNNNSTVIGVNFAPEEYHTDYVFISNIKRYNQFIERSNKEDETIIVTSNISSEIADYTVNYGSLRNSTQGVEDNVTLMLIKLLIKMGVRKVKIAGFDGYEAEISDNYADKDMSIATISKERAIAMNTAISNELAKLSKYIEIEFVTPTKYSF